MYDFADFDDVEILEYVQVQRLVNYRICGRSFSHLQIKICIFQQEKDLELAAKIGQSLLERNKELQHRNEALEEQLNFSNEQVNHTVSTYFHTIWTVFQGHPDET